MGLGALHPALVHTTPRRPMRFLQCRHSRFITFLFKLLDECSEARRQRRGQHNVVFGSEPLPDS